MQISDVIADMLTRIRNANDAKHETVDIPASNFKKAIAEIQALRKEFWQDVKVVGTADSFNVELEKALRLVDYLELGELMARDALNRAESCGGHFRAEHQTEDGEALRHDEEFAYAAVWEYKGENEAPELTKEDLVYEFTHRAQRNYKD